MNGGSHVIVVGVDGSDGGRRALQWAAREAAARGSTLKAVTAWRWDLPYGGLTDAAAAAVADQPGGERAGEQRAADLLATEIAAMPTRIPVASQVLEGRPAEALAAAAHDADLLVLGSHGHSRMVTAVLGSVTQECIRKVSCPVVVIPVPHDTGTPAIPPAVPDKR